MNAPQGVGDGGGAFWTSTAGGILALAVRIEDGTMDMTTALRPDFGALDGIAQQFEARWCVWKYGPTRKGGKRPKLPFIGKRKAAKPNEPEAWLTSGEARRLYEGGGFDGVGILLSTCNPALVAIDIDDCLNADGTVTNSARNVVDAALALGTYSEKSPSGAGLRLLVQGVTLDDCREKVTVGGHSAEIYGCDSIRYVTLTGHSFSEVRPIAKAQSELEAFQIRFGFLRNHGETTADGGANWPPISDGRLRQFVAGGDKGRRLLAGDSSDYDGASEARAALIGVAGRYSDDVEQIARLIEASGLCESKKGERRGGEDFAVWEARRVLEKLTEEGKRSCHWHDRAENEAARSAEEAIKKAKANTIAEKAAAHLEGGLSGIVTSKGVPISAAAAAAEFLRRDRRLTGAIFFDAFAQMPLVTSAFDQQFLGDVASVAGCVDQVGAGRPLTDADVRLVERWLFSEWGIALKGGDGRRVVFAWADEVRLNPVADRLRELGLQWDGKPRLARLFLDYLHAHIDHQGDVERAAVLQGYYEALAVRWLVGIVARGFEPGCKNDVILIIQGRQGALKSTAVRVLTNAVRPQAFLEGFTLSGNIERALQNLRGRLVVEFGELDGMGRHEAGTLKNFLSTRVDSYRDPYAQFRADFARTAVIVGTTNDEEILIDPTGNRRFWFIEVGKRIDLRALERDAPQLWAEAVVLYQGGQRWWIDEHGAEDAGLVTIQAQEAAKRLRHDSWSDLLTDFANRLALDKVEGGNMESSFSALQLLQGALCSVEREFSALEERRMAAAALRPGSDWERYGSNGRRRYRLSAAGLARLRSEVMR